MRTGTESEGRASSLPGICYVAGAMPLSPDLLPHPRPGDSIIAADRGFQTLTEAGLSPDLVVGDFDSLGHRPQHPNLIALPAEKDDTDMVFALRRGLDLGYRRFVLLGGLGGRLDHTMANLQTLNWLTTQGAAGLLAGEGTVATVLRNGTLSFSAGRTGMLSVFAFGTAKGVTLSGLKYTLQGATLADTFPLGVSNEFTGTPASVAVEEGALLLLWGEDGAAFQTHLPSLWPCSRTGPDPAAPEP